jgi:hypothetical protein
MYHVTWKRIETISNHPMVTPVGHGYLHKIPEVGESMVIFGDNGVSTSRVKSVTINPNVLIIETNNSTYKVTKVI